MKTRIPLLLLPLLLPVVHVSAQTAVNKPGTVDYTVGSNWSAGVPTSTTNASITNGTAGTPTVVNLNAAVGNVADLTLGAFDFLNINLGSTFNINGSSVANGGAINVNAGSGNNTVLQLAASTTLSGGGTLTLNSGDLNGQVFVQQSASGVTLTNANNTIQGYGTIGNGGLAIANNAAGTINANVSGRTLFLNGSGGLTNAGLLEASGGGVLQVSTGTVNNLNGNITANGGTMDLTSVVQGGTLNSLNGGLLQTAGSATLDGSTQGAITISNGSTYTENLGSVTSVQGTLNNHGTVSLTAGSGNNTVFQLIGDTTLQSGGTVTLNSGDNNGQAYIQQGAGGLTLTNVDNTIQGYGVIGNGGLALNNQATIDANASGQTLTLNGSGGVANTGLLEATNGGTLHLVSNTVGNAGAHITANGGTVLFTNELIQGGTLTSTNGGSLINNSTTTLDASTNAMTLSSGSTWTGALGSITNVNGTFNNNGTINLIAGSGNNTFLQLQGNTTLQGGGTVTLNSGDNNGQAYIQQGVGGLTLTNVDNLIQGYGVIGNGGLMLNNQATINANVSGQTLTLNGSGNVTNTGVLEATNGGTLHLANNTISNAGAHITADGGTVLFTSELIQGGTITGVNGGSLINTSTTTLDASTNAITLSSGSTWTGGLGTVTNLEGTFNNLGAINLTGGGGNNTFLQLLDNTTLQGGGTVTLNSGDNNGQAFINQGVGGLTLTNVDNTIQGYGTIGQGGLAFTNHATVNANVSGQTLNLNGSGNVINTALLEATNGGTLNITNDISNAGANINASGGTVTFNNATIHGGTLGGGGPFINKSSTMLDGLAQGALTLSTGSTLSAGLGTATNLIGTFNNQGAVTITAGGGNNTFMQLQGDTTLQGGGTVTLNSGNNNGQAFILQAVGGLTLTNAANTIQGYGVIGQGGLTVVNGAAGTLLANSAGNTLVVNGSGGLTNNGTLQADAGGTLQVTSNLTNFSGNTLTGGTYVVNGSSAANGTGTLQLNLPANTGGEIVNNAATIVLNGPTANTKFVDSNGHDALTNLAANSTAGSSLTVAGGYDFTTAGAFSNAGTVHAASGGTFTASHGITGPAGTVQIDAGGTVSLAGGSTASTVGTLNQNGTLALGTNNVTVSTAYNNANFGVGNSFDNHANVTGSGLILAAGNTALAITGSAVTGGTTTSPTLANFGNVHVGQSVTLNYSIANSGTTGPSILGAIQTAANGGNITDSRLSGSGVTASNFGPLGLGQSTTPYAITFNATTAGALASGQTIHFASNFDNVPSPTLTLGGGAAYQLASANTLSTPINLGNIHTGGVLGTTVNVTNTAPNTGGFTETLGAAVTGTTGAVNTTGSVTGLAQGASSNAIGVSLNTGAAGALSGSATVAFSSQAINGSGLGNTALGSQTVNVTGTAYQLAAVNTLTTPVNLGNVHVGGTLGTTLNITNTASNTGGFTETLGASVTGTTGAASTAGSITGLAVGASSNAVSLNLNTATAGALTGTATVAFTSQAINGSGLGTTSLGSQIVHANGAAYNLASASLGTINFGNVLVGSSVSRFLNVSNTAAPGSFSEGLDATLGTFSGTGAGLLSGSGSITNLAAGSTSTNGLSVGLNTSAAGTVAATVQVNLASNGATTSGLGITALPSQSAAISGQINAIAVVGNLASASAATPNPVNLGNVRIGAVSPTQALTISNTLVGPGEGLNASISTAAPGLTATGSFTSLQGGNADTSSLVVGMNTASAGLKNGTATITLASDGSFNSGVTTALPSQTVAVTGAVYQTAQASVLPTSPINLGSARIGGTLNQALTITNSAPNTGGFTETLGGTVTGTTGAAQTTGAISGVAQGASSNAISVGLSTGTAGAVSGSADLGFTSSAVNGSGLATIGVGSQTVNLTGAVYQSAIASALPTSVNLGTVRSGTVIDTAISLANVAPLTGGYTETLGASFGTTSAGLLGTGSVTGLAAGAPASTALSVQYTAGAAGSYSGAAAVNFNTEAVNGSGLGTLAIGSQSVGFSATVNAIANAALVHTGGFNFNSTGANSGTLNFGVLTLGSGSVQTTFDLLNNVTGLADLLNGTFDASGLGGTPFGFGGNGSFSLGDQQGSVFDLTFDTNAATGFFTANLFIDDASHNAFQTDLGLPQYDLTIQGTVNPVSSGSNAPDAGSSCLLLGLGLMGLVMASRWTRRNA